MTSETKSKIKSWLHDKLEIEVLPDNVIALNFGIQKVFDGYELYQQGCDDFNKEHDTWLLSEVYTPKDNFFNLGRQSLDDSENKLFEFYKRELTHLINQNSKIFSKNLKHVTISFLNGPPVDILSINEKINLSADKGNSRT